MIIHDTLSELGLESREVDLYLALLQLGPASIRDVAKQAGINRGTAYELLKGLHTKGLVTYHPKGKRRLFSPEQPEHLLEIARTREAQLAEAIDVLTSDIIPDLKLAAPESTGTRVHYYEGDAGIETVLRDILNSVAQQDARSYSVYSARQMRKYLYRPFPHYTRQRVERGIRVRVIALGEGGEDAPLAERKWIEADERETAASYVAIYPPKCAMISLAEGEYPTAVVIDSPAIAMAMQVTFNTLWRLL